MRFVKRLLLLAGAILLAVLVHRVGAEPVLETLRALAWWQFVIICLPYGVIAAVDTLGWRFAFARDGAREPGRVAAPLLPSRVEALRGLHRVSHARLAAGRAGGDADALAARHDRLDGDGDRDHSARLGRSVRIVHGAGQPRRHRGGLRCHLRRARLRRRRRARVQLRPARATGGVDRGGARGAAGHALVAGTDARAGYAVRFLKYEFLTAILPRSNVNTSQPLTSIFLPSAVVPVKTHSERPRSPATKWRASPKWASGKILKTFAKASHTRSRPSYRVPQASLPAVVSKTQSSAMKVMMKSTSCRFQPSPKASRSLIVTIVSPPSTSHSCPESPQRASSARYAGSS